MPTHIKGQGNRRLSDVSLAVQALNKIGATIDGDTVVKLPERKNTGRYDHQKRLSAIPGEDGVFHAAIGTEVDQKERHAFDNWIRRRAVRVGKGKYKLR